jgi:uncharacterized membrane protein SpoIIM required for sporulation
VTVSSFVRDRQATWTELDQLLRKAKGRPERLGPDGIRRLGALYRGAVADLAWARRAFPGDPAARSLEGLVARARAVVYSAEPRRGSARSYLGKGYWQAVRERRAVVLFAFALLIASTALVTAWAAHDPGAAAGLVPGSLATGGAPHRAIGLGADQSAALSITIFLNNIKVTFLAFGAGILFGVGPAFLLLYNGAILGAVAGIASNGGHAADVIELVAPHGVLELSCIAVSAAAGMRMGWTLVEPGTRTRRQALAAEAPRAVLLVLATAPWLVVAGLVEGFVTPHHLPLVPAVAIGLGLATPYWGFVLLLGRRAPRAVAQSRKRALA